jgi:hypothetical protein
MEAEKTEIDDAPATPAKEESPTNAEEKKVTKDAGESKDEPMPDAEPEEKKKTQAEEPAQEPEPETTTVTTSAETKPTEEKSAVDAIA